MRELILSDLVNKAGDYQLEGVEFTQEDVDYVERLIADGKSYDEAIGICLSEIYDVLTMRRKTSLMMRRKIYFNYLTIDRKRNNVEIN